MPSHPPAARLLTRCRHRFAPLQAYRKQARQWHPDVNPSEEAKAKFQEINEAYSVSRGRPRTD